MFLYVFDFFYLGSKKEMDELGHLDESMTLSAFGTTPKASGLSRVEHMEDISILPRIFLYCLDLCTKIAKERSLHYAVP